MAARRGFQQLGRSFTRSYGTFGNSARPKAGTNKTIFIAAPCACFLAWQAWKRLSPNVAITSVVRASESEKTEVGCQHWNITRDSLLF